MGLVWQETKSRPSLERGATGPDMLGQSIASCLESKAGVCVWWGLSGTGAGFTGADPMLGYAAWGWKRGDVGNVLFLGYTYML